jgi:hypothetical protein
MKKKNLLSIEESKKLPSFLINDSNTTTADLINTACFLIFRFPEIFIHPLEDKKFEDLKFKDVYSFLLYKKKNKKKVI